jgi:hypothetical protein
MDDGGFIGFVAADDRFGGFSYAPETGIGSYPDGPLPNVDIARGFNVFTQVGPFGITSWLGYRTPQNEWAEIAGAFLPPDAGALAWGWTPMIRSATTDWQHAVFAGEVNRGGVVVATRAAGPSSIVEQFVRLTSPTDPARFVQVGSNRLQVEGEIAATRTDTDDIWLVSRSIGAEPRGLMLRRGTDCFANDW